MKSGCAFLKSPYYGSCRTVNVPNVPFTTRRRKQAKNNFIRVGQKANSMALNSLTVTKHFLFPFHHYLEGIFKLWIWR